MEIVRMVSRRRERRRGGKRMPVGAKRKNAGTEKLEEGQKGG
jgi:hypothetical protein